MGSEAQQTTTNGTVEEMGPVVEELREISVKPGVAQNSRAVTPASVPPINTEVSLAAPLASDRPETGISFASYYAMETDPRMSYVPFARNDLRQGSDSPVYGLNGIMVRTPKPSDPPSPPPAVPSTSRPPTVDSFDELLRQQTELDKSIAALRLFSPTTSTFATPTIPDPATLSKTSSNDRSQSMSTISRRADSVSNDNRSEFSLSIFPDPPFRGTMKFPPSPSFRPQSSEGARAEVPRRSSELTSPPLASKFPEDAITPQRPMRPTTRFGSNASGSQYDVTSFIVSESPHILRFVLRTLTLIPDLTSPVVDDQGVSKGLVEGDAERPDSPVVSTGTGASAQALRPLILGSSMSSITSLPSFGPATTSSGLLPPAAVVSNSPPQAAVPDYEYPVLKPFLLGTASTTPSSSSPLAGRKTGTTENSVFISPRKNIRGPGKRPKVTISGPRLSMRDGKGEEAPGAFERPRPPPLVMSTQQQQDTSVLIVDDVKSKSRDEQGRF